jgi:hypothetical protein
MGFTIFVDAETMELELEFAVFTRLRFSRSMAEQLKPTLA